MKTTFAIAITVLVLFAQTSFAQSGSASRNAIQGTIGNAGSSARGVVQENFGGSGTIQGQMMEPSSVVSGEVIQSEPMYTESAPMSDGTVVSGGAMYSPAPMASSSDCGCGASPAPAVTYSAPVTYAAPAAAPCCPPQRRGLFRTLFGR